MRLDIETEVRYPDGERAGWIKRVVMDEDNEVTAIVLATDDLVSRELIVPIDSLSEHPGGVTTLNLSSDELDNLTPYEEYEVPALTDAWVQSRNAAFGGDVFPGLYEPILPVMEVDNLGEDSIGLSQGTEIRCLDGAWGIVDEVLTNDEDKAYAFIGRPYAKDEIDRIIPLELVTETRPDLVLLNCTLADLPTYTEETANELEEPEQS
jgi:hypothetical protein